MATLNNLTDLIANAKSTNSGKIEWTDTSLKGIQQEVEYLFSQNAIQVVTTTSILQATINDSSQLAFVTTDPTDSNNGIYYWSLTPISNVYYPAGSNGYWNLIEFGVTSSIAAGYIPYSNGSNLVASYLQRTTDEIKMVGGSFVANKSTSTGPYFQCGDTDSVGNDVILTIDDKNQVINSKKATANKGIKLDFANNIHKIGDIDANKGLSVDTANSVYKLGNTASSEGVVINLNNGYIGNPTWGYTYNATTLYAGNASINLTLNDTANTATLGDGTKGLTVDVTNNGYILGNGTNGLNINTTGTYTLGNGTKGLSINTTNDDYTLGSTTYGLVVDATVPLASTAFLGEISSGNGLSIFSSSVVGDQYSLASSTAGKGLFIDLGAETYKLGTYGGYGLSLTATTGYLGTSTLNYRYTATTVSVGTSSLLLNIDNTAGSVGLGSVTRGISMQIVSGSPTYSFGNLSSQIGAFLGQTTGYLGYSNFGYNYTSTTMIAGNSSVNLTLDDTTNIATVGTTSLGFKVNVPSSTMNVGDSTKGLFVDILNTIYTLGTASNGLVINTTGAYTLGNGTKGLSLNTTTNTHKLGDYTANTVFQVQTATGIYKTTIAGLTTGILLNPSTGDFVFGTDIETLLSASYFGARGTGGGTPSIVMTQDFIDPAPVGGPAEKVLVSIPGLGNRWIQLYN
jgi:hypothetical protein